MLKDLHTLSPYLDFLHACSADPDYRDPMLLTEQQLHRNLLDAPENPNTRVLGTFENDTVTGVFALLVLEDEKYLELLAGLSRSAAAYDELLAHLKSAYPGYQADFVYNPRNRLLQAALEALDAKFDPEQQKLVLRRTVPYVPDARIVPYRPGAVSGAAHRRPLLDGRTRAGCAGNFPRSAGDRGRRSCGLYRPDPQQRGKRAV